MNEAASRREQDAYPTRIVGKGATDLPVTPFNYSQP